MPTPADDSVAAPPGRDSSPRRGRPPRGAALLSRDAIVEATLKVIDSEGINAVSMRSVARILGVDAKSLYNHVEGKDGLLDAVAEQLLGSLSFPDPTGDVREDLRAIAYAFRDRALRHPEAAALVLTRQLASWDGLAPVEAVLGVLRAAGCPPEEAVHLLRMLVATLVGTLLREVSAGPTFGVTDLAGVQARREALDRSGLPAVGEASAYLARFDPEAEYAFTVDVAIQTVAARHYRRHDERYALYLSYEVKDSEAAQARILAAKEALRSTELAVDSLTTFDANNSEAAKNVQSSNSSVGTHNGQTYRHANGPNGWFSWDLAVDPTAGQNLLSVRYFSGDVGRSFDIYVDGTKLKTETISNAAGAGVFYWQSDALPAGAVGDGKVTVKFQSTGGLVGGVFGIRTMKPEVFGTDARLSALTATPGTLSPAFDADTASYVLAVPEGTKKVALDLDPHVASGLVRVNGVLIDDTAPRAVDLAAEGPTTVEIESFAQDHETSTTYTLTIQEAEEPAIPAIAATMAPKVTGTAMVGRRLSATTGTWNVSGATTSVQWLRNGVAVPGATSTSYVVRTTDVGARLSVRVVATKPGHTAGTASSAASAAVAKATTTLRVTAPKKARTGKPVKVTVVVAATGVGPSGTVRSATAARSCGPSGSAPGGPSSPSA